MTFREIGVWALRSLAVIFIAWGVSGAQRSIAQDGHGQHEAGSPPKVVPKVFLDKSPKIVEYQLKRLTNAELLLLERDDKDKKFVPVHAAILSRIGMASGDRKAAADALAVLKASTTAQELFLAMESLTASDSESGRVARDLSGLLLTQSKDELATQVASLETAVGSKSFIARRAAFAALVKAGKAERARQLASASPESLRDLLAAVTLLDSNELRNDFRSDMIRSLANNVPAELRLQAIQSLGYLTDEAADSFAKLVELNQEVPLKEATVKSMLRLPVLDCPNDVAEKLVTRLVEEAISSPVDVRSSDAYLDAAQLAEALLVRLPAKQAKQFRDQLRAAAVRVVRIRTVEEEMRYDLKHFAVEAGKPVEIVLINEDLMPHNLVVTVPAAVKEIALAASAMAPDEATDGKQYVPRSEKVLYATGMVQAGKQERLAFTAPTTPGEYPYVCTFPNHWMRMVGVMVVVSDVDEYMKDPKPPADPIGNNRTFVKKWTVDEISPLLSNGLKGRSAEIGKKLFAEATCAQCHKWDGAGGNVGPDLSNLMEKWKDDRIGVLREILDPSHKIDPKYAAQSILTTDGKVYSGIIIAENQETVSVVASPDQKAPVVVKKADIDEMVKSSKSIMPVGLMDQFTQDEILEILALITKAK